MTCELCRNVFKCTFVYFFQDFANDDVFSPEIIESQPSGQFTMLPPVENTPESYSAGNVVFEPLPDIATAHQVDQQNSNRAMMRPRVSSVGPPMGEYGQGDTGSHSDLIQGKLKLQKIVCEFQNIYSRYFFATKGKKRKFSD